MTNKFDESINNDIDFLTNSEIVPLLLLILMRSYPMEGRVEGIGSHLMLDAAQYIRLSLFLFHWSTRSDAMIDHTHIITIDVHWLEGGGVPSCNAARSTSCTSRPPRA